VHLLTAKTKKREPARKDWEVNSIDLSNVLPTIISHFMLAHGNRKGDERLSMFHFGTD
jgi:hypothetical protein